MQKPNITDLAAAEARLLAVASAIETANGAAQQLPSDLDYEVGTRLMCAANAIDAALREVRQQLARRR